MAKGFGAVVLVALISGSVLSAQAADAPGVTPPHGRIHRSVSLVTQVDPAAGVLVIKLDGGKRFRLLVDRTTAGESLAELDPGDIIREHCVRVDADTARALLIRRVRTASEELGSFEQ
ncbi:MAG: hypothetical protein HYY54_06430 [candidate division NC10 bacterium]|nr:hypothetical protein [candidate division NC10 bacterium]MBI3003237.1 hypothetical protein [candidate division NC10 bacterium]